MLPLLGFYLGGRGVKPGARIASAQPLIVTESTMVETEEDDASGADIPPPVTADDNLDGVSLREKEDGQNPGC